MRMELLSFDEQVRQGYLEKHDERIVALIDAYKVITEHPILGIGFGSFAMASTNKVFLPHNWLISSWVSAGVAGAAAIVYLCISSIRSAGKVIRNPQNGDLWIRRALFVSLVMVWFHGLFRPVEFNAGFYVLIAWAFSEGRRRVLGI
jgi:O-antigen ligase